MWIIPLLLFLIASCGGSKVDVSLSLPENSLEVFNGNDIRFTLNLKVEDLFEETATVEKLRVKGRFYTYEREVYIPFSGSGKFEVVIPHSFYSNFFPFNLVKEFSGIEKVVLTSPASFELGTGDGETVSFSGDVSGCILGTLQVSAGGVVVGESSLGVFSSAEVSGYVSEGIVNLTFSAPPQAGVSVLLNCQSPLGSLSVPTGLEVVKIVYGSDSFYLEGSYLVDASGNVVGKVNSDGSYEIYTVLGFKPSPITLLIGERNYATFTVSEEGDLVALDLNGISFDMESFIAYVDVSGERFYGEVLSWNGSILEIAFPVIVPRDTRLSVYFSPTVVEDTLRVDVLVEGKWRSAGSVAVTIRFVGGSNS